MPKLARALGKLPDNGIHHILFKLALIALTLIPPHYAVADQSLEDGVKAAYLYKFSSYVEWPSNAFNSPVSPFNLCILSSNDQFVITIKKIVHDANVNGRKIIVNELRKQDKDAGCHILYIGTEDPQRTATVIEDVRGSNILTVSDNASQGIIGFTIVNNRLRFNIDDAAAAQNGLIISSRLLNLAVNVKRRE